MMARTAWIAVLLAGISGAAAAKEVKVVYDVIEGNGEKLYGRIETIDETRMELVKHGDTPHFILTFRGPATKLVQTDMEKVKPEDREWATKIAEKVKPEDREWATKIADRLAAMSKEKGVRIEQCAVAIRHQGTAREKVLPVIKVVDNSFITIAEYQSKGYAYILP
jgi:intracellular sulfur oxidation DsrE/DsrF family protein